MLNEVCQHNLNLLPALALLIETGNVSEAAKLMNITQSSMSRNLSLLREALNDPILIRDGNSYSVTPTAQELLPKVRMILGQTMSIFETPYFNKATCLKHFRISSSYTYATYVFPNIIRLIHSDAPKVTLSTIINTTHTSCMLVTGGLDIYVGFLDVDDIHASSSYGEMFVDQMYIVMRRDHPLSKIPLNDTKLLLEYPYVQLSGSALPNKKSRILDNMFSQERPPWLSTTTPHTVFDVLNRSDAFSFMTATEFVWSPALESLNCRPLPNPVYFSNKVIWPSFLDTTPSHRWLREIMLIMTPQILFDTKYCENLDSVVNRSLAATGATLDKPISHLFHIKRVQDIPPK